MSRDRAAALLIDLGVETEDALAADLRALVAEARAAGREVLLDAAVDVGVTPARKPAPAYFLAVCAIAAVPPDRCLFLDRDARTVSGARAAGLPAFRWTGPRDVPYLRAALDL